MHSGEFQRDGRAGPAGVSLPGDAGGGSLQLEPAGGDPLRAREQGRGHDSGDALAALGLGIGRDAQVADHGGHMLARQVMQEDRDAVVQAVPLGDGEPPPRRRLHHGTQLECGL